jgi:hypothetical protein
LLVQTVFCVILAIMTGPLAGLLGAICIMAATFALIIAGTIQIASGLERARQVWLFGELLLLVTTIVYGLVLLIRAVL